MSKRKSKKLSKKQSSKSIDTLVSDIYGLFDGANLNEERLNQFGQSLAALLRDRFASYGEPRDNYLRFSNLGKNPLQLWYDIHGTHETEPLTAADKLKFLYGDIIEQLVIFLAEEAGHRVDDLKREVKHDGVKGRIDCTIDGEVVDVKSASSYALNKFTDETSLRTQDSFGYIEQLSGYAQAHGKDQGYFLAMGKENGELKLCRINADDMRPRIRELREILSSDVPPFTCGNDKELGTSGNRVLKSPCTYCKHKQECWKDANGGQGLLAYEYSDGIKYFTNVAKEPQVKKVD